MTLEDELGTRYRVASRMPAFAATHHRYVTQGTSGSPEAFVLSYCDYAKPLSAGAIEKQKAVAGAMSRPPVAMLCRTIEWRIEPEFQWVVSELPEGPSLREVLQQRQFLTMEE